MISSTIAVRLGTSSSISPGASCPSDCANGRTGSNHWDLVLDPGRMPPNDRPALVGSIRFRAVIDVALPCAGPGDGTLVQERSAGAHARGGRDLPWRRHPGGYQGPAAVGGELCRRL